MPLLERLFQLRDGDEETKPFLQHLEELRWMLIKMAIALVTCMAGSLWFQRDLIHLLERPLNQIDPTLVSKLQNLGIADPFTIALQLAFYAGLIVSFPCILFFLAQFVIPALTRKEIRYVFPAIGVGAGLFATGVLFAYFWVLPQTLSFFFHYSISLNFTPNWAVRDYFAFVTQIMLGLGLAFELPVAVMALVGLGFINFDFLNRTRPYAIVLVMILAAIIAPTPDIITFISLAVPMCLLYEGCIWLAWLIDRKRRSGVIPD